MNKENEKDVLLKKLEENGIDPFLGDCFCVAMAIQKIIDPSRKFTALICIKKSSYGDFDDIAHCFVRDLERNVFYDASGVVWPDELMEILSNYNIDDECLPDEFGDFEDEYCTEDFPRSLILKKCGKKITDSERIIREVSPGWIREILENKQLKCS